MKELFRVPKLIPENVKFDIKSIHEEVANMISHGIGWLLGVLAAPILLYFSYQSDIEYSFISCLIYVFCLIMVYTSSTLYHSAYQLSLRRKLRIFDHISIYFLIAGSYTPFLLPFLRTNKGLAIFIFLWVMVVIGTVFKLFFTHKFKLVSTLAYVFMGWIAVFIYSDLVAVLNDNTMLWIKIGGALYTFGTIFYLWRSLKQNHFIWHLFVLAGSIAHYIAVLYLYI